MPVGITDIASVVVDDTGRGHVPRTALVDVVHVRRAKLLNFARRTRRHRSRGSRSRRHQTRSRAMRSGSSPCTAILTTNILDENDNFYPKA